MNNYVIAGVLIAIVVGIFYLFLKRHKEAVESTVFENNTPVVEYDEFIVSYVFNEPSDPQFKQVKGWSYKRKLEIITEPQPHILLLNGDVVKYKYIGSQATNVVVV